MYACTLTIKLANKLSSVWDGNMILALANSKGRVGKSTIAVHLAAWLFEQGRRLVLVDSDLQG